MRFETTQQGVSLLARSSSNLGWWPVGGSVGTIIIIIIMVILESALSLSLRCSHSHPITDRNKHDTPNYHNAEGRG